MYPIEERFPRISNLILIKKIRTLLIYESEIYLRLFIYRQR